MSGHLALFVASPDESRVPIPMPESSFDFLRAVQGHLHEAARLISPPGEVLLLMSEPKNEIITNFPVFRSRGRLRRGSTFDPLPQPCFVRFTHRHAQLPGASRVCQRSLVTFQCAIRPRAPGIGLAISGRDPNGP